jgi:hypothetical protein
MKRHYKLIGIISIILFIIPFTGLPLSIKNFIIQAFAALLLALALIYRSHVKMRLAAKAAAPEPTFTESRGSSYTERPVDMSVPSDESIPENESDETTTLEDVLQAPDSESYDEAREK